MYIFLSGEEVLVYVSVVFVLCLSAMAGRLVVKKIILRDEFYKNLKLMLAFFENNLQFVQTKVEVLFDDFLNKCSVKNINSFLFLKEFCVNKGGDFEEVKKHFSFLKKEEINIIVDFFQNFGSYDISSEVNKIKALLSYAEDKSREYSEIRKQNESLIYKVSLAVGAVICILIL